MLASIATERISLAAGELLSDKGKSLFQRPRRSNRKQKVSICRKVSHAVIYNARSLNTLKLPNETSFENVEETFEAILDHRVLKSCKLGVPIISFDMISPSYCISPWCFFYQRDRQSCYSLQLFGVPFSPMLQGLVHLIQLLKLRIRVCELNFLRVD